MLCGSTLGSDHCSHSLRHQGGKAGEVDRGEGTPAELFIFACIMFVIVTVSVSHKVARMRKTFSHGEQ